MPDYISREEAVKAIMGEPPSLHYPSWFAGAVKGVPSADVRENTHGRWIEDDYAYNHCSECGHELEYAEYATPYCPQCGASMEPDPETMEEKQSDFGKPEKQYAQSEKMTRHKAICDGIHDLYERKNHDYGDSFGQSFRDHGILAGVIRIEDKFNRLKTLAGGAEQKVQDESIRDTLRDMANYAIMTLLEMGVQNEENQSY